MTNETYMKKDAAWERFIARTEKIYSEDDVYTAIAYLENLTRKRMDAYIEKNGKSDNVAINSFRTSLCTLAEVREVFSRELKKVR